MSPRSKDNSQLERHDLNDDEPNYVIPKPSFRRVNRVTAMLIAMLALSVTCNVYTTMVLSNITPSPGTDANDFTPFARLSWSKWIRFEHGGVYNSNNETLTNEYWEGIDYDTGSVALSDEYVAKAGLPKAQRFPWDNTKGLYFLNGQHQLHCLKTLRRSFLELRDHQPLSFSWPHNMHCFNTLRQEIMCTADDTPRYTSVDHPGQSGMGQYRRCRDWSQLEDWSRAHTSCWRDINATEHIDPLLRYRYCPPGSQYADKIHAIFGDVDMGDKASAAS